MIENEILKAEYTWRRSPESEPWLVVFSLAEIDGRIECVGMEIRSYVRRNNTAANGQEYETYEPNPQRHCGRPQEDVEAHKAWWAMAQDDIRAMGFFSVAQEFPQPLRALTLRQLPFADVLARARRDLADLWGDVADLDRDDIQRMAETGEREISGSTAEELEVHARQMEEFVAFLTPPLQKGGRHAKYTMEHLRLVAKLYSEAYAGGSTSPTKDVAEQLRLPRNQVAKLVMRCRDPQLALLAPTEQRRAGGLKPQDDPSSKPSS
jgi:hypothetical protein